MPFEEFRSKKIRFFRNGDIFTPAKKVILSARTYRNFEQFLQNISGEVKLMNGAVRKVFTLDGKLVTRLDDFEEGGLYIGSAGEAFKRAPYQLSELKYVVPKKRQEYNGHLGDNSFLAKTNERKDTPIFNSTTKPIRVYVFRNGDVDSGGRKIMLNYKNCQSFSRLLTLCNDALHTVSLRKLYDGETGKQITTLHDIHEGQLIVGLQREAFQKVAYQSIDTRKDIKKKENDVRKIATFFPNGDAYHSGYVIPIQTSRFPSMRKLMEHINSQYNFVAGPIRQIFSIAGERITNIDKFQTAQYVLVSGNDQFIRIKYNLNQDEFTIKQATQPKGLAGMTQNNELMSKIRKAKSPNWERYLRAQGMLLEKEKGMKVQQDVRDSVLRNKTAKDDGEVEEEESAKVLSDDENAIYESSTIERFNENEEKTSDESGQGESQAEESSEVGDEDVEESVEVEETEASDVEESEIAQSEVEPSEIDHSELDQSEVVQSEAEEEDEESDQVTSEHETADQEGKSKNTSVMPSTSAIASKSVVGTAAVNSGMTSPSANRSNITSATNNAPAAIVPKSVIGTAAVNSGMTSPSVNRSNITSATNNPSAVRSAITSPSVKASNLTSNANLGSKSLIPTPSQPSQVGPLRSAIASPSAEATSRAITSNPTRSELVSPKSKIPSKVDLTKTRSITTMTSPKPKTTSKSKADLNSATTTTKGSKGNIFSKESSVVMSDTV